MIKITFLILLTYITGVDTSQHNGLNKGEESHIGHWTGPLISLAMFSKVLAVILMHQGLNSHENNTPSAHYDHWGSP